MGGTPSFRVSPSTFMVSLELTSSIFQDSSRERIFLYGLVQSLMITFRRKRANWKVNIILREKVSNFIIIYLRIEKFLDRRSTYVREGREGEGRNSRWGKVQRHEAIGLSLSPGRIAGGCDLLHFLESTAGQHIVSHARFTWMYWFFHWFDSLLLFTARIITWFTAFSTGLLLIFLRAKLKIDDRISFHFS